MSDDAALRKWLADYLVTNIGCSPNDVDFDASFNGAPADSKSGV
jgi:hypothetical protein